MNPLRWFRRNLNLPQPVSCHVDIDRLDHSMQLLKTTTAEVSKAAVDAARVLEEQLQTAETRFNSTIDHLDDLVIVKDDLGRWKTLNKAGQDVFGWHHGEFFDKTDSQLALQFPIYKETLFTCHKTDRAAWECGHAFRTEEVVPYGNEKRVFDVVKTPVYDEDGSPKELIIIGRDVTEIRERSRRTKACFHALNSASDVIAIVDNNCRIFFCNDRFTDAFNITDYNSCVGQLLEDIVGHINPKMWKTVQQNKVWKGEFQHYHLNVLPMMNGEPKPIYHVCTFKIQK